MGSYNGLTLDDDILDRIMTFCPTFGTLHWRVFIRHEQSVPKLAHNNILGSARCNPRIFQEGCSDHL
jgi:hypothetical protein